MPAALNSYNMKRIKHHLSILLFFVLIFPSKSIAQPRADVVWQEVDGVNMPIPPAGVHPRLYLRSEEIPEIKNRINDPVLSKVWKELQKQKKDVVDNTPEEEKNWRHYFTAQGLLTRSELSALEYLMTNDAKYARAAIEMISDTLATAEYRHIGDISRAIGRLMISGAMVYDWCYDQLTPDEKTRFVASFVRLAEMLECGYPPVKDNSIVGHASEWMIMRDLISTGIAIYDEFPEMYHLSAGRYFREHLPARNWFYPGGAHHQGMSYMNVRFANDLFALWIFDKMGAGNVYDPSQQYIMYDVIYKRRPDGQVMPGGDVNYTRKREAVYPLPTLLAGSYYKDEYINYEYMKRPSIENQSKIFEFLWRDPKIGTKKPDDLPLTRYSGSPFGWMVARTSWDENCVIAEMKVNEYNFLNHQHHDAGSFQLYYKGPLAIDAGTYQGSSGGYNSPHNKNFFKRTIAHNSLLIFDPNEKFAAYGYGGADKSDFVDNDGGQRLPGGNWSPAKNLDELFAGDYKTGTILAHGFGPDTQTPAYSYLKGDITEAYSDKVKEVKRSFVFLNLKDTKVPGALIVFDKIVSSDASFKKYWLLHSIEEPSVKDNTFTIKRTQNGDSGMLVNTLLLPELSNAEINPVGGPGKEFWVFGKNYPNEPRGNQDEANERGAWRIEISPKKAAKEDYYLNVIQVADNKTEQLNDVKKLTGNNIVGVQIADRVTTFSANSELLISDIDFTVNGKGNYQFLITDLSAGEWKVMCNNKVVIDRISVAEQENTLNFDGNPGKYKIVKLK